MNIDDEKSEKITTDVQFNISGKRDNVYELLEKLRKIISEANNSTEQIEILVNTNTTNMGIEAEDGQVFEDEATMIRWKDLQENEVDLDAMIMLNKTNNAVETTDITAEALNDKINSFTETFMPQFLKRLANIIDNMIGEKILHIEHSLIPRSERNKFQHLKLAKIDIVLKAEYLQDTQEVKQIVVRILEEFFDNKGVSKNMAKNIEVKIQQQKQENVLEQENEMETEEEIEE